MTAFVTLLETTLDKVLLTFAHNWPFLLASILVGSLIKLYLDKDRVAAYLRDHQKGGVVLATAVAVGTPLCSCGTTAIVIGMMASMMPWAPIVAFMVSSPLSSPEGMFYTAGLFGWPFALAAFIASILLGLAGGLVASLLDKSGWLKNQARLAPAQIAVAAAIPEPIPSRATCGCQPAQLLPGTVLAAPATCGCQSAQPALALPVQSSYGSQPQPTVKTRVTLKLAGQQLYQDGTRLLVMFFGFAFLGYLLNGLIPRLGSPPCSVVDMPSASHWRPPSACRFTSTARLPYRWCAPCSILA
jgi:uncharacterized membrane protein YraQ (UPF0718 family)